MKKPTLPQKTSVAFTTIMTGLLCLQFTARVQATDSIWNGGGTPDGNWQNANNWGGIAPLALDSLFFDGNVQTLTTNNFPANTIFANLTFSGSADTFKLYGNSLVLTNGSDNGVGSASGGGI